MIHHSFSIKHAFVQSFKLIYNNFKFLFGLLLIQIAIIIGAMFLYNMISSMLVPYIQNPIGSDILPITSIAALVLLRFFTLFVEIILFIVTIRIFLDIYDQGKSSYNDFFQIKRFIIPYILASILFGLAVALGFVVLVIPGLFLVTILYFYDIIVIDQSCGAVEALKISEKMSQGTRIKLFLFIVVCTVLSMISFGLLYPIILMARIDVYKKLKAAQSWL